MLALRLFSDEERSFPAHREGGGTSQIYLAPLLPVSRHRTVDAFFPCTSSSLKWDFKVKIVVFADSMGGWVTAGRFVRNLCDVTRDTREEREGRRSSVLDFIWSPSCKTVCEARPALSLSLSVHLSVCVSLLRRNIWFYLGKSAELARVIN